MTSAFIHEGIESLPDIKNSKIGQNYTGEHFLAETSIAMDNDPCEKKNARSWLPDRARFWTLAQGAGASLGQQSH